MQNVKCEMQFCNNSIKKIGFYLLPLPSYLLPSHDERAHSPALHIPLIAARGAVDIEHFLPCPLRAAHRGEGSAMGAWRSKARRRRAEGDEAGVFVHLGV